MLKILEKKSYKKEASFIIKDLEGQGIKLKGPVIPLPKQDRTEERNEHNLDVIKTADTVIDLGPEGGEKGGHIIAVGTPEEVAQVKDSYTGQYLKKILFKCSF